MLDTRVYRAAFAPAVLALVLMAFSLIDRPRPLQTTLAPDAFSGERAFQRLGELAREYPERRPGSAGDEALAADLAGTMRGAGLTVSVDRASGSTIDGKRTLTTVSGTRTGRPGPGIVVVAHRDAAGSGAEAELSGTAALEELVRVFAGRSVKRSLTLVSTSGGSGGAAGAEAVARRLRGSRVDAVIVLGDLASATIRKPWVQPWSDGPRLAPMRLRRTVEAALRAETGQDPGGQRATRQLARLAFPFALGEEGRFNAAGLPAVTISASGERGPSAGAPVSADHLRVFGRATLRTITALDNGPSLRAGPGPEVTTQRKVLPGWSVRLFVGALLLPVLLAAIDGLARVRRRHEPVGVWVRWLAALVAPFALAAFVARMLGAGGAVDAPGAALAGTALGVNVGALAGVGAAFVVGAGLVRPLRWIMGVRGAPDGSGPVAAVGVTMALLALVTWIVNPYAALLVVVPAHLWLLAPESRLRRVPAVLIALLGLLPIAGVLAVYSGALGLAIGDLPWSLVLLVAGGGVGALSLLGICVFGACGVAALRLAGREREEDVVLPPGTLLRGPIGHVGQGTIGGTQSGLRVR